MATNNFFTEALRTKADAKVTDLKAERTEVLYALRAVSKELESQVKRGTALRRLFPDRVRASAGGHGPSSTSSMAGRGELDDTQQVPHRHAVQPFPPAIVKLLPIEEALVTGSCRNTCRRSRAGMPFATTALQHLPCH